MWYTRTNNRLTLNIYVQPGAKATAISGLHDGSLKIRLNAPPIEGRANAVLQKYLAQLFEVPVKQVRLIRGGKSRHKVVEIVGSLVNPDMLCAT